MANRILPALNDVIRIDPPRDEQSWKAIVQIKLNGGTITVQPRTIVSQAATDLTSADGQTTEYHSPGSSGTIATADITAAGIYEFMIDGKSLFLTVSAISGAPVIVWNVIKSEASNAVGAGGSGGATEVTLAALNTKVVATAKGTQGATAFATQDLKDSGRANISFIIDRFNPAATAETIVNTLSYSNAYGARTTGATSYPVTTAKTLRLQLLTLQSVVVAGNTTAAAQIVRMRVNPAGAAIITSAIVHEWVLGGVTTNPAGSNIIPTSIMQQINFQDGQEFPAGAGICFTVETPAYAVTVAAPQLILDGTSCEY